MVLSFYAVVCSMANSGKEKPISKEIKDLKDQHILEKSDTKRERKSPMRFSIAVPTPVTRELVIPKGRGVNLGAIPPSLLYPYVSLLSVHHATIPIAEGIGGGTMCTFLLFDTVFHFFCVFVLFNLGDFSVAGT